MDGNEKFFVWIWTLVAAVLIAAMGFGTLASDLQRKAMVDMVEKGADPMRVSCAFGIGQNDVSVCTLLVQQGAK